jgi:hypothetical protein
MAAPIAPCFKVPPLPMSSFTWTIRALRSTVCRRRGSRRSNERVQPPAAGGPLGALDDRHRACTRLPSGDDDAPST